MPKKHVNRPLFRRGETYVTLRPLRMTSKVVLKPGEEVDLPSHRLRSLYERRRIGPKGHPWTEAMLKSTGFPTKYAWVDDAAPKEPAKTDPAWGAAYPMGIEGTDLVLTVAELAELVDGFEDLTDEEKQVAAGEVVAEIQAEHALGTDAEPEANAEDAEKTEPPKGEPVEPVKDGSRWVLPGLTKEKFTSKKKALEWLEAQSDAWLDGEGS